MLLPFAPRVFSLGTWSGSCLPAWFTSQRSQLCFNCVRQNQEYSAFLRGRSTRTVWLETSRHDQTPKALEFVGGRDTGLDTRRNRSGAEPFPRRVSSILTFHKLPLAPRTSNDYSIVLYVCGEPCPAVWASDTSARPFSEAAWVSEPQTGLI